MKEKTEFFLVFIVIGVVIIFLVPTLLKIFYDAEKTSTTTSVNNEINAVQTLYITNSTLKEIDLPFTVKYNKNGYDVYSDGREIDLNIAIDRDGESPISGKITIAKDGSITANNLKYDNYTCQKDYLVDAICQKN